MNTRIICRFASQEALDDSTEFTIVSFVISPKGMAIKQ